MKKILLFSIFIMIVTCVFSQQYVMNSDGYVINVQIKKSKGYATLRTYLRDGNELFDSVRIDNKGRFAFRGYSPEPIPALLTINGMKSYRIYLEPGLNMTLKINPAKDIPEIKDAPQTQRWYSIVTPQGKEDYDVYLARLENWVLNNPQDIFSPDIMAMYLSHYWSNKELSLKLNTLKGQATEMYHYKHLRERESMLSNVQEGKKVPEINLKDLNNKTVSLNSVVRKNKYVLIDFWASWCVAYRQNYQYRNEIYKTFKDKSFDIYGVSLDKSKKQWKDAVEEDNIQWTTVSELKGWDSEILKKYFIKAIPANVLVDNTGKIIKRNLSLDELNNTLNELLVEEKYVINGKINGITEGIVKLELLLEGGKKQSYQTRIEKGGFSFEGKVDKPCMAILYLPVKDGDISFFMFNDNITVTGEKKNLENIKISGSPSQDGFVRIAANCNRQKNPMQCLMNYVADNPTSIYSPFIISNYLYPYMNENDRMQAITSLDGEAKTMFQYTLLKKQSTEQERHTDMQTNKAKDFVLENTNGQDISLYEYLQKKKYTLVVFWASWDNTSRNKNTDYLRLWNVYSKKDFSIISVSLDDSKYAWTQAVKNDGISKWENVSDLKRWASGVVRMYNIKQIPYNMLLDKSGNILGENLSIEEIIRVINEK